MDREDKAKMDHELVSLWTEGLSDLEREKVLKHVAEGGSVTVNQFHKHQIANINSLIRTEPSFQFLRIAKVVVPIAALVLLFIYSPGITRSRSNLALSTKTSPTSTPSLVNTADAELLMASVFGDLVENDTSEISEESFDDLFYENLLEAI